MIHLVVLFLVLCILESDGRAAIGSAMIQQIPPHFVEMNQAITASEMNAVDLVSFHDDVYGIPWNHYTSGSPLPAWWVQKRQQLKTLIQDVYQKPVFLSLTLLDGTRQCPGYNSSQDSIDTGYTSTSWGCTQCYDFGSQDALALKDAYIQFVKDQIEYFEPAFLNYAVEMNAYMEHCAVDYPGRWDALVSLTNEVYDAVKLAHPQLVIFPSFILYLNVTTSPNCVYEIWADACVDDHLAMLDPIKRDLFAVSTYPYGRNDTSEIFYGQNWFSKVFSKLPTERFAVVETGFITDSMVIDLNTVQGNPPFCVSVVDGTEARSEEFLRFLLNTTLEFNVDMVIWWSMRDYLPVSIMTGCGCDDTGLGYDFCSIYDYIRALQGIGGELIMKVWGTMGLHRWDGTPKQGLVDITTAWRNSAPWPVPVTETVTTITTSSSQTGRTIPTDSASITAEDSAAVSLVCWTTAFMALFAMI